jgi:hypothetical protein
VALYKTKQTKGKRMGISLKRALVPALGIAVTVVFAANSKADLFDTTLASPDTNAATGSSGNNPSWFNGSGNPQGGWTVSTTGGIEVGLRTKYRNVNGIIDSSTDDYSVTAGGCISLPCSSTPHPTWALWNYEFSIDLQPNGIGSLTLAGIAANTTLTVTDVTTGATGTINPLTHWGDDTGFGSGPGGAGGVTSTGKHVPEVGADWAVQNSQNLGFGDSPLVGFFNPNASDEYDFTLTVKTVPELFSGPLTWRCLQLPSLPGFFC